jgi:hypothetical protein
MACFRSMTDAWRLDGSVLALGLLVSNAHFETRQRVLRPRLACTQRAPASPEFLMGSRDLRRS